MSYLIICKNYLDWGRKYWNKKMNNIFRHNKLQMGIDVIERVLYGCVIRLDKLSRDFVNKLCSLNVLHEGFEEYFEEDLLSVKPSDPEEITYGYLIEPCDFGVDMVSNPTNVGNDALEIEVNYISDDYYGNANMFILIGVIFTSRDIGRNDTKFNYPEYAKDNIKYVKNMEKNEAIYNKQIKSIMGDLDLKYTDIKLQSFISKT